MHDAEDESERPSVLLAFPGVRDATPKADLLPTRSFPAPVLDPDAGMWRRTWCASSAPPIWTGAS